MSVYKIIQIYGACAPLEKTPGPIRQLTRYLAKEVRPKIVKVTSVAANDCQIVEDVILSCFGMMKLNIK